jgi:peptide/nickel transport system ATP-binding protein
MNAFPDIESEAAALASIEGSPPPLTDPPPGCRFAPRCPFAEPDCTAAMPQAETIAPDHWAACRRAGEAAILRPRAREAATWRQ